METMTMAKKIHPGRVPLPEGLRKIKTSLMLDREHVQYLQDVEDADPKIKGRGLSVAIRKVIDEHRQQSVRKLRPDFLPE